LEQEIQLARGLEHENLMVQELVGRTELEEELEWVLEQVMALGLVQGLAQ
jgi:hypothetical protein